MRPWLMTAMSEHVAFALFQRATRRRIVVILSSPCAGRIQSVVCEDGPTQSQPIGRKPPESTNVSPTSPAGGALAPEMPPAPVYQSELFDAH